MRNDDGLMKKNDDGFRFLVFLKKNQNDDWSGFSVFEKTKTSNDADAYPQ